MEEKRKQGALTAQGEITLRIEWEVFAGVLDRLLFLADNIPGKIPDEHKADFQYYAARLKQDVLHAQEQMVDVLCRAGIDFSVL